MYRAPIQLVKALLERGALHGLRPIFAPLPQNQLGVLACETQKYQREIVATNKWLMRELRRLQMGQSIREFLKLRR